LKVLLISDNKSDWEIIRRTLRSHYKDIQLVCCINKQETISAVTEDGPFGFFMLDCNTKNIDPTDLGFELLELTGSRPIIFIGYEGVITDRVSQALYTSSEFNDTIYKPLDREDILVELKNKIDGCMQWAKDEEFEQSLEEVEPEDYLPMKLKAFYLYNEFPYDIYLSITQTTYIKIISANKPYTHSTLATYARKNIKMLYIKKDDQLKYLETESIKCIKALNFMEPNHKDIYLLQIRSVTILHQYILALGVSPSVLSLMNAVIANIHKTSRNLINLSDFLQDYPIYYQGIPSKSIITAFIACHLAKKVGWESSLTQSKLIICSLLQDITLPDDDLSKINNTNSPKLKDFKEEDLQAFFNHPNEAAKLSKQFSSYSDIDYIVESQHELPNRKGFPNRPSSSKLTQICAVFNTSQYVAAEIDGESPNNNHYAKIIKTMSKDFATGTFKETLNLLKNSLKVNEKKVS